MEQLIVYSLLISICINIALFIPAYLFKTDRLTDASYAITFITLALFGLLSNKVTVSTIVLTTLILFWATRLGTFLVIRVSKSKKDKRFDDIRNNFFKFLGFWILQAITVWIILIPTTLYFKQPTQNILAIIIGTIMWILGFLIESIADLQKISFKNNSKNKNKFISEGLWKYSRHPNYFGEILCWIGIFVYTINFAVPINIVWGLISPVFITILLLFFSGIPPLEKYADKKWGKEKEYIEYKRTTSILVPWFK